MSDPETFNMDTLAPLLTRVVREHKEKVVGWMRDEPGCWGFLSGQAVSVCREHAGRSLEEAERKLVWDRLWWLLENIKKEVLGG